MTDQNQNQPRIAINSLSISTLACGHACEIEALPSADPSMPGGVALRFHRLAPDNVPAMIISIARALSEAYLVPRDEVNALIFGDSAKHAEEHARVDAVVLPPVAAVVGRDPVGIREIVSQVPQLSKQQAVSEWVKNSDDPPPDDVAIGIDPAPVTGLGTSAPAPSKPKRTRTKKDPSAGQAASAPPAPPAEDLDEVHPDEETDGSLAVGRDPAGLKGAPQPAATAHEELGQTDEIDEDLDERAPPGFVTLSAGKHASIERVKGYEKFYDVVQYTMNLIGGPKRNLTLAQLVAGLEVLHPHSAVLQRVGLGDELQRRVETALSSREITITGMSGS